MQQLKANDNLVEGDHIKKYVSDQGIFDCKRYTFNFMECLEDAIREGFKNPRHGNFPLGGGVPPPGPPRTRFFRKVIGNFLTEKGGTPPPPLTDDPLPKMDFFPPKTAFFAQKHCFWANFKWIFS